MQGHRIDGGGRRLLRITEVADQLACHPNTVRRMVARGTMPVVIIGGLHRFRPQEVDEIVRAGAPLNAERPVAKPGAREGADLTGHESG